MKPTQEQIWNAAVALAIPEGKTFADAVSGALILASEFEKQTAHLDEPAPTPIDLGARVDHIPCRVLPRSVTWPLAANPPEGPFWD